MDHGRLLARARPWPGEPRTGCAERYRAIAEREGTTLSRWIREAVRERANQYDVGRKLETLDKAWTLATSRAIDIWSIEADDLALARSSIIRHPELSARDLLHLACCRRRGVGRTHTFDRALRAAVEGG